MDKQEFNVNIDRLKTAVEEKDFATSLKIVQRIDWNRVKSVNLLTMASYVYEENDMLEQAKTILNIALERSSNGKRILYKLTELAVRSGDVEEAENCYQEYKTVAASDPACLVLQYMILKVKHAPYAQLIQCLEYYNNYEPDEKWMYELATTYEAAGRIQDAVGLCDRIALMFGNSPYVVKALKLKQKYQKLTEEQRASLYPNSIANAGAHYAKEEPRYAVRTAEREEEPQPAPVSYADQLAAERMPDEDYAFEMYLLEHDPLKGQNVPEEAPIVPEDVIRGAEGPVPVEREPEPEEPAPAAEPEPVEVRTPVPVGKLAEARGTESAAAAAPAPETPVAASAAAPAAAMAAAAYAAGADEAAEPPEAAAFKALEEEHLNEGFMTEAEYTGNTEEARAEAIPIRPAVTVSAAAPAAAAAEAVQQAARAAAPAAAAAEAVQQAAPAAEAAQQAAPAAEAVQQAAPAAEPAESPAAAKPAAPVITEETVIRTPAVPEDLPSHTDTSAELLRTDAAITDAKLASAAGAFPAGAPQPQARTSFTVSRPAEPEVSEPTCRIAEKKPAAPAEEESRKAPVPETPAQPRFVPGLHLIIEALEEEEGIEIARKELAVIYRLRGENRKVAKASAEKLNQFGDPGALEAKIGDRDLVISTAGDLSGDVADQLYTMLEDRESERSIVFVDTPEGLDMLEETLPELFDICDILVDEDAREKDYSAALAEEEDRLKAAEQREAPAASRQEEAPAPRRGEEAENAASEEREEEERPEARKPQTTRKNDLLSKTGNVPFHMPESDDEILEFEDFAQYCIHYANGMGCNISGKALLALYEKIEIMEEDGIALTRIAAEDCVEEAADHAEHPGVKGMFRKKYDKDDMLILREEDFIN